MAMRLVDGDYVPDERGGFEEVTGTEAVMQRVLLKLKARRGGFPPLPGFGSRLYLLTREKPSGWQRAAEQYVNEALADESAVEIKSVSVKEEDGYLSVTVEMALGEKMATVSVSV